MPQSALFCPSELERLIKHACKYHGQEPDMEIAKEISEIVKQKTINAHKSVELLSAYFVSETPQECVLSLFVLDILMVECGYPVHLAVSKRDLLNKFAYRFPPNANYPLDQAHQYALYLLNKWCIALCEQSKNREDFGNIRLMHSLLKSRGFPFPRIDSEDISSLLKIENEELKSREEILNSQRVVLEAKLEDLLRKGSPSDLKAANELMQVLADQDGNEGQRVDFEIEKRLRTVEERCDLLESLLWNTSTAEYSSNQAIQSLFIDLRGQMEKMEVIVQEDLREECLNKVLQLTDRINCLAQVVEDPSCQKSDMFSLMKFEDQSSEVEEKRKIKNVKKIASFVGETVIIELYELEEDILLTLFNISPLKDALNVSINFGSDKVINLSDKIAPLSGKSHFLKREEYVIPMKTSIEISYEEGVEDRCNEILYKIN